MKRYRVLGNDFDTRARILATTIESHWESEIQASWQQMKSQIRKGLAADFGPARLPQVEKNLVDLGAKPFSVLAFHNRFLEQARVAFIGGAYYPALVGACALGERVLNHLVIRLRSHFSSTPQYKRVYRKKSFDDWRLMIDVLDAWNVLLPEASSLARKLCGIRNKAVHFDPVADQNDRPLALVAIQHLSAFVECQFGSFGTQPWFIPDIPGASYLRRDFEDLPFIKEIYLPNALLVGPGHRLEDTDKGWIVHDAPDYADVEISDDEFRDLLLGVGT